MDPHPFHTGGAQGWWVPQGVPRAHGAEELPHSSSIGLCWLLCLGPSAAWRTAPAPLQLRGTLSHNDALGLGPRTIPEGQAATLLKFRATPDLKPFHPSTQRRVLSEWAGKRLLSGLEPHLRSGLPWVSVGTSAAKSPEASEQGPERLASSPASRSMRLFL